MSALDLDLARETFESSTDFTIGLEEEFAILDPGDAGARAPLRGRLRGLPGGRGAGRVGGRRADRLRDRDPLRPRRDLRRGGRRPAATAATASSAWSTGMGLALGATGTHPWAELPRPADHRHAALQPAARGTGLGRAAQQHLEPARPHGRARRRPGDRRLRLAARAAAAAARRLGQLALPRPPRQRPAHGAHRDLHPHLPALRRARARSRDWDTYADFVGMLERTGPVVESTQLWWSVRPHHTFGTVEVRICDAQTRGEESTRAGRA